MGTTMMGVKLDGVTRERTKTAVLRVDHMPHWLTERTILNYLERLRSDDVFPELPVLLAGTTNEGEGSTTP